MIERTKDYDLVDSILNDPEILKDISSGKLDKPFKTRRDDSVYYLLAKPKEVIGVFIVHRDSPCSYKIHANILKHYRKEHSKKACDEVVQWVWDNIPTNKLNCDVPVIYQNVIDRAKATGFKLEGIRRKMYVKDGEEIDVALLGIERQ